MIDLLKVLNLDPKAKPYISSGDQFVLKTCQRTLILGFGALSSIQKTYEGEFYESYEGHSAYIFLLETICGLKSEVLAEYEVVAQFKQAYHEYLQLPLKNSLIINLLEKLFKDSKKIRTDHLLEIGQLSYAGISRKILNTRRSSNEVLVIGSGTLAEDLIKLLKKKYRVYLSARNLEKVGELALEHSLEVIAWKDSLNYSKFNSIINTVGSEDILFNEDFFDQWKMSFSSQTNAQNSKLFIDLGSPSVIKTNLTENEGVLRLEDIFKQSSRLNEEKMEKIRCAKEAILLLADNRRLHFSMSYPFGWEELQFA